jgi:hypothetical protein
VLRDEAVQEWGHWVADDSVELHVVEHDQNHVGPGSSGLDGRALLGKAGLKQTAAAQKQ